jgi:uncharacterized protein (DUF58 family)
MALFIWLLFLAQRALYNRFWDRKLALSLSFSSREAVEGEALELREELTNAKPLPLPWVTAKFQLSRDLVFPGRENFRVTDDYYQNDLFRVAMYQRIVRRQEFICGRRGYYRIKSADLGSSDVVISMRLIRRVDCAAELTVLPRLIPVADMEMIYKQMYGEVQVRRFTNPDPFAFRGIREYERGDDFRFVNFKATAKTGQLMVNVAGATASQELVILLNLEPYSEWAARSVMEEAIRIAASVADHFCELGLSVGLVCNGRDAVTGAPVRILPGSGARHAHNIMERLARVDLAQGQDSISEAMAGIDADEPVYLLISPSFNEDVRDAFDRMDKAGLSIRWILPTAGDVIIKVDDHPRISLWEVEG